MKQVKLGIIGIGNMGTIHCKNIVEKGLVPNIELAAIADINEERRAWAKENLPETVKIFESGDELIEKAKEAGIEAVLVAVPHYQHPTLSIKAMQHGLHVMCEKPAGVYTKQVKEMNEVADKCDVVFGMMFNQRTNCVYRKIKEMVTNGELGDIRRVNWIITSWYRPQFYYDSGAWRATWAGEGGGVLLNQCPHNLDLMQWICGLPTKVRAFCHVGKWHDIEVEDDVTAYMEFANGATGVFITTTGDAPGTNRLEITGNNGTIVTNGKTIEFRKLEMPEREFNATTTNAFGSPKYETVTVETDGLNEAHSGVLKAFAGNILDGTPLVANGKEGINGLTLSNAMHLSSWLDKTIELPFDEDLFYEELQKRVKTSKVKENVNSVVSDTSGSYNN